MSDARLAGPDDLPALLELRRRVFVEEQGVPVEIEQDHLDRLAVHAVARDGNGQVVGTGRLVVGADGTARIGRMAVAPEARGSGTGAAVLAVLEAAAARAGCRRAVLHAQVQAIGFYRRAGYAAEGEPFDDAGIPHVAMARDLS
ncbi:MAG: GNAT family N-acetyltransferase [Acidimicrobiales bacterium]